MESKLVLKPTIEKAPTEGMCGQRNTKHVAYVDKELGQKWKCVCQVLDSCKVFHSKDEEKGKRKYTE